MHNLGLYKRNGINLINGLAYSKLIRIVFFLAILILMGLSILSYQQIQRLITANAWVLHTHQVIGSANNVLSSLIDAESQERAYVITGDINYVTGYAEAEKDVMLDFTELKKITSDNLEQQRVISDLAPLLETRLEQMRDVINIRRKDGAQAAAALMIQLKSQLFANQIRVKIAEINNREELLLKPRTELAFRDSKLSSILLILAGAFSELLLLFGFFLLNYQLIARIKAEQAGKIVQSQMKGIIEGTNDLIAAIDMNFKFIAFNNAYKKEFYKIFGEEVALGMSILDALAFLPEEQKTVKTLWERALNGEEFTVTREFGDSKRERNYYEITYSTINDPEGKRIGASHILRNATERMQKENSLKISNEKLEDGLKKLKQHNQEITLLSEMNEALQTCQTLEEAYSPIAIYVEQILKFAVGSLYIMNASHSYIELAVSWGAPLLKEQKFPPEQCWALRHGRLHRADRLDHNLVCGHMKSFGKTVPPYICVPLMAQNEILGLLYLEIQKENALEQADSDHINTDWHLLAVTTAEQIALSLANIKLRESLRFLSIRDPLTGLFNRRYLEESLEREFHRAQRKHISLAIIMMDIDHFKELNDSYGHEAGDLILKEIGHLLHDQIRGSDIACRYGGEEFILFLYETTLETALERTASLQHAIREIHIMYAGEPLDSITVSQGIAFFPMHGSTPEQLINAADRALYQAKKKGRDCVVVYSETGSSLA